jgi:hypothetical protein
MTIEVQDGKEAEIEILKRAEELHKGRSESRTELKK